MEQLDNSIVKTKIARFFSAIAHPILLVPVYSIYVTITQLTGAAVNICIGITVLASVLLIIYMMRQVRKQKIADFDASNQAERQNRVFLPIIGVLAASYGLFFYLEQPASVLTSTLFFGLLFIVGYGLNFFIKASLHVAIPLFLGCMAYANNPFLSFFLWGMLPFVAWSRLVLQRHTRAEIAGGSILGASVGMAYCFFST